MKPLSRWIAASLVANAVFAAAFFLRSAPNDPASTSALADAKPPGSDRPAETPSPASIDPKLWRALAGLELPAQVAQLRAAGYPPVVIRALITAQIEETYAAKRQALGPPVNVKEFWKADALPNPKIRAALRELDLEQERLTRHLLGPNPNPPPLDKIENLRHYGGLAQAKIDRIIQLKRDYAEMTSDVTGGLSEFARLPEDAARLALLQKEQRADLARILSPSELAEYDLRTSSTADQMRYSLRTFAPTEAEFREIFQRQSEFDEKFRSFSPSAFGLLDNNRLQSMQTRADAQRQLQAEITAALGPDRGAEYARSMNNDFQNINRIVERLDLPTSVATAVWLLQKDLQERYRAVQTNRTLSPAAANEQRTALASEATAKLTAALGPRGFDLSKQSGGWALILRSPLPVTTPSAAKRGGGGIGRGAN